MTHESKRYIDVFNGDADGICALVQLRRSEPRSSTLVTGIKRDINLLKSVKAEQGDCITVLDISFEKNHGDVARLLNAGVSIKYVDHHKTGELISHVLLDTDIDLSAETCTSLIVDKQLQGKYRAWAITAAFGDNLAKQARALGQEHGLDETQLELLQKLGIYLNYNGYGSSLDDLFYHPADLYGRLQKFDDPFDFLDAEPEVFDTLNDGYLSDMAKAEQADMMFENKDVAILSFPNEKWARRVSGVFGNDLVNRFPDKGHAVLTVKENGNYLVSVRAPLNRREGADELVSQFPTGGGRKAAAGINDLPKEQLEDFIKAMDKQFAV
ncbi:MAG: DHH family phosphoesterase [Ghiorsea sp.]